MKRDKLLIVLIAGIAFRIFVFLFQAPFNNDYHFEVIKYIRETKSIPLSTQMSQGYHPPLYYLLAQIFYCGDSTFFRLKVLQFFSLLTSILTFVLLFSLVKNHLTSPKIQLYSGWLLALLPQFVMFGNFVSNDSLANFFGALIIFQSYLFLHTRRFRHLLWLSVWLGLGLLTKATFLAFIPVLLIFIVVVQLREKKRLLTIFMQTLIFTLIVTALGSYKYVQNYIHFGRPFIHNTDPLVQEATGWPWAKDQKGTYQGLSSWLDWNIAKLVKEPTLSESTRHSFFLLLYGTLWYQYIHESNLEGNLTRFKYFGSFLYILALGPTLLMMAGGLKFLKETIATLRKKELTEPFIQKALSLGLFLSTLALIVAIGLKTDVWSCFQARIFFPAIWGMIVLYSSGLEIIENKRRLFKITSSFLNILYISFIIYFLIELGLLLAK
ncbi:MAG: glycosyltransferase family 39 protein [Candidatus Aminicenantes bacterium]|nr:glycosyltransferase family 39 protein [Candidatus Aminicenantes bacterium]